jgi:hypothetical protein
MAQINKVAFFIIAGIKTLKILKKNQIINLILGLGCGVCGLGVKPRLMSVLHPPLKLWMLKKASATQRKPGVSAISDLV